MTECRAKHLNRGDQVRVKTKLQNRPTFCLTSEFGVYNFIGPRTEIAGGRYPPQDICATYPSITAKCALNNDFSTSSHGLSSTLDSCVIDNASVNHRDGESLGCQMLNKAFLMSGATFPKQLK